VARAPDEFPDPSSRTAAVRLRLAKALPGIIFATYLLLWVGWADSLERILYAILGGIVFQLLPLLFVAVAYHLVCWVAGIDSGTFEANPSESRRLLAGMVAVAALWAWNGIQNQSSMKELIACVEERVEYEPQEPIRYVIDSCRASDDDDYQDEF
jgi:hypothetical protein